ncbi:immunity 42 family protein [Achromobacter aegrifaciens]|uniref:immunity 42 family protein n=1 Tax=Achromobacter aegrifaciens TaxID=1287736 RepID=UPI001C2E2A91|nr:immunity 42 family protein [Achromobacter aegrifaciens]
MNVIFGDTYKFAILMEHIPVWGSNYRNGLFYFFIGGEMFPEEMHTATLDVDVCMLDAKNALVSFPENRELFEADAKVAFNHMLGLISPELVDEDADVPDDFNLSYLYQAATQNIYDAGCHVFCVAYGDEVRIIGAKISQFLRDATGRGYWSAVPNIKYWDVYINKSEVEKIISDAVNHYKKI